jgi:hypothetical protein
VPFFFDGGANAGGPCCQRGPTTERAILRRKEIVIHFGLASILEIKTNDDAGAGRIQELARSEGRPALGSASAQNVIPIPDHLTLPM